MTANSARYQVECRVCGAQPGEPCRTLTTGRVTDAHNDRIWLQHIRANRATTPTPNGDENDAANVTVLRCPAKDPDGQRCRLYRGHDGEHGDGLGAIWKRDYSRPIPPAETTGSEDHA